MSNTKEIITIQIGHYSNFVGTHWWNLQEASFCYDATKVPELEINHDVHFCEGKTLRGHTTYTPRLLAIDLKGSLNTLKQTGTLYDISYTKPSCGWDGNVDIFKSEPARRNEFLKQIEKNQGEVGSKTHHVLQRSYYKDTESCENSDEKDTCQATFSSAVPEVASEDAFGPKTYNLDNEVKVWSDFLKTQFHSRSICLVDEYFHDSEQDPFDLFGLGLQVMSSENFCDDVENRLRLFSEECDFLQGFNILLDGYNGFSGVAAGILNLLNDDYKNQIKFCCPLYQPEYKILGNPQMEEVHRLFSSILCFENLAGNSSLFCPMSLGTNLVSSSEPLSFSHLNYNPTLPYHTSAIITSALDTITLPFRHKKNAVHMVDIINTLSIVGRKMATFSLCLPVSLPEESYLSDIWLPRNSKRSIQLQSLLPNCDIYGSKITSEAIVLRGIPSSLTYRPSISSHQQTTQEELLSFYLNQWYPCPMSIVNTLNEPCKVTIPFPDIFKPEITSEGFLSSKVRRAHQSVQNSPVLAGLHSTNNVSRFLEEIVQEASRRNIHKYHRCWETGSEPDDLTEALHSLEILAVNYSDRNEIN
ncbi:misato mitochondrial distribution and morphology regulator isoform X2 [Tachypleus tridentatus]|uniref:misato mitochondrial distribution and morphology regulator isoform X2 n=1 Tax=Tachypleus tridentatus TaxID=6853 RepID=UPI003FD4A76D